MGDTGYKVGLTISIWLKIEFIGAPLCQVRGKERTLVDSPSYNSSYNSPFKSEQRGPQTETVTGEFLLQLCQASYEGASVIPRGHLPPRQQSGALL